MQGARPAGVERPCDARIRGYGVYRRPDAIQFLTVPLPTPSPSEMLPYAIGELLRRRMPVAAAPPYAAPRTRDLLLRRMSFRVHARRPRRAA